MALVRESGGRGDLTDREPGLSQQKPGETCAPRRLRQSGPAKFSRPGSPQCMTRHAEVCGPSARAPVNCVSTPGMRRAPRQGSDVRIATHGLGSARVSVLPSGSLTRRTETPPGLRRVETTDQPPFPLRYHFCRAATVRERFSVNSAIPSRARKQAVFAGTTPYSSAGSRPLAAWTRASTRGSPCRN